MDGVESMQYERVGKITLRTHEVDDLPPLQIDAELIRDTREQLHVSRAVFARRIRISIRTLENWEQGRAKPNAQAVALIMMILAGAVTTQVHAGDIYSPHFYGLIDKLERMQKWKQNDENTTSINRMANAMEGQQAIQMEQLKLQQLQLQLQLKQMDAQSGGIAGSLESQSTPVYGRNLQTQTCRSVYDCPYPSVCEYINESGNGVCQQGAVINNMECKSLSESGRWTSIWMGRRSAGSISRWLVDISPIQYG